MMMTRRLEFIGVVSVAAVLVCWAGTAGAQALVPSPARPERCRSGQAPRHFPATGQTTVFHPGDDGDIQAGATPSYTDNGDGTITDNNTCLMWEKKSDDDSIHDQDNVYAWENAFDVHVATLNATRFAGYDDWRLPNVKELQSIVNYGKVNPAVSTAFNNNCTPGSTVLTGSCTAPSTYWSSSSTLANPLAVPWGVAFGIGFVAPGIRGGAGHVRAVRGGAEPGSSR